MDYEKEYKKLKAGISKEYLYAQTDSTKAVLEAILPELKESEGERIKKRIYNYINVTLDDNESAEKEKWLAWLEKQGKSLRIKKGKTYLCTKTHKYAGVKWREGIKYYSPEDYSLVNQGCTCYCPKYSKEEHNNFFKEVEYDGCLEKQCEHKPTKNIIEMWKDMRLEVYQQASGNRHEPNYSDDTTKMFSLNDIDEIIEKMSEQKSDDKVDPKFHEGDWITNGYDTWKIVEVKPLDYILQSQDGNIVDDTISYVDAMFDSWTVQDAKDGDVLVAGEVIFIFNKIHGVWINCHCSLHKDGSFNDEDYDLSNIKYSKEIHPATKEQRELLFQKMKEAGYEWDAEMKEPKKIEQNPAWSEEDERLLNATINTVLIGRNSCEEDDDVKDKFDEELNWLKSLKERIGG